MSYQQGSISSVSDDSAEIEPGDIVHCRNRRGYYRVLALKNSGTALLEPIDESWVKRIYCPLDLLTPAHPD